MINLSINSKWNCFIVLSPRHGNISGMELSVGAPCLLFDWQRRLLDEGNEHGMLAAIIAMASATVRNDEWMAGRPGRRQRAPSNGTEHQT